MQAKYKACGTTMEAGNTSRIRPIAVCEGSVRPRRRHLVLPGGIAGTAEIMRFLAEDISRNTYINSMDQYRPAGRRSTIRR